MTRTKLLTSAVLTLALLAGLVGMLPMPVAYAANITVNSTADTLIGGDSACTLREAIMNANSDSDTTLGDCVAGSGPDTITLPAGTYTLAIPGDDDINATGDLDITADLTITGAGAATTIVAGNLTDQQTDRVFHILPPRLNPVVLQASPVVIMSGMTIRDGYLDEYPARGGGILNEGDLTLQGVIVTANVAIGNDGAPALGGGIYNEGYLTIEDSTISDNEALGGDGPRGFASGGGIFSGFYETQTTSEPANDLLPTVTVTIRNSTISGNLALAGDSDGPVNTALAGDFNGGGNSAYGGGLDLDGPTISFIEDSTVSGNTAQGGEYGGEEEANTQQGEGGDAYGGGIHASSMVTLTNCTISGNTVQGGDGPAQGEGNGGGLFSGGEATIASFCTIAQNTASTAGGGVYEGSQNEGDLIVKNTIVANNTAPAGPDIYNNIRSGGWNLIKATSGGTLDTAPPFTGTGNITGVDPSLGALALNLPGSTKTHALLFGSAAIDTAEPACSDIGNSTVTDDQRGVGRPIDGDVDGAAVCDIGAYEYQQDLDCGDAPDPTYPTLIASNGACHIPLANAPGVLGAIIDYEPDGQPTAAADGDDLNGQDDEDGVTFTTDLIPGGSAGVDVVASLTGYLNAWIDFNGDGDWADAGEQIFADQALAAGSNSLTFPVPPGAIAGPTFARFRYSQNNPQGELSYQGVFVGGEVEDYLLTIRLSLSLGDLVWYDTNQDGIQDTGEPGVQNIKVDLYRRVCTGEAIAFDTTDASGNYLFEDLFPGIYCLQFSDIPAGWSISPQKQGTDDTVDSDADPTTAQIIDINLQATDLHEDMGLYAEGSIGDTVWCDADGGNDFDPGEGVAGVTVSLYDDPGCDGVAVNLLTTLDTIGDGQYLFGGLPVGPVGSPVCYFATVDVADMGACNVPITPIEYAASLDTASPDKLDADFGFAEPPPEAASIGDYVWRDANVNGIQDAGEAGVGGVAVILRDCEGATLQSTTTTASGFYSFVDLDAGSYELAFSAPADFLFTLQNQGDDPALDSDADPATGQTVCTTLAAGEDDLTWDAGLYQEIIEPKPPEVVPEASTLLLLGSAASGLAGYAGLQLRARKRKRK